VLGAFHDQPEQSRIKWVLWICPEEPLISVTAAYDQVCRLELDQLILHRVERQETQATQLSAMQFLPRICKQQSQHFGPNQRK